MDAILAHHTDNIIMFDVPEPFQSLGIDAYRQTWDMFFKYTKPGVFNIRQLQVVADENVAFCIATMKCSDKSDGGDFVPLDFRLTIGLTKINNQWMIVHEHHSIPAK
jgi:ketosteroid isomerase-like protein